MKMNGYVRRAFLRHSLVGNVRGRTPGAHDDRHQFRPENFEKHDLRTIFGQRYYV